MYIKISKTCFILGFPHNPYNGVICNDVIAASGVFTAKELWKFTKGDDLYHYTHLTDSSL